MIFFLGVVVLLIGYGLLHAGLIKLPPAEAYDCSRISKPKTIDINIDNSGFHPDQINATVCDTLVFTNQGQEPRWPAVGPHPTHTSYPGFDAQRPLSLDQSFRFTVTRPGSYSIHDHLSPGIIGTVTISLPKQ